MSRIKKGSTATKFNALLISVRLRMSSFSVIHVISHLNSIMIIILFIQYPEKLQCFYVIKIYQKPAFVIYNRPISRTITSKLNETPKVTELFKP